MKLKTLLLVVGFVPTMVMAQPKPATPPVIERPVALNPPARSATAPQQQYQKQLRPQVQYEGRPATASEPQYQKPPVPVVPASTMSGLVLPALESARDAANKHNTYNMDRGSASKQ